MTRAVRGLGGVAAGGVIVLALFVVVASIMGQLRGFPGPGWRAVFWHVCGAGTVVVAQRYADGRAGNAWVGTSVVNVAVAALLLWTQWWR